jgi:hypothetical protein
VSSTPPALRRLIRIVRPTNRVHRNVIVKSPPFQSRSARGKTPHQLAVGDERDGLYLVSSVPDLYPITSGIHPQTGRQLRCQEEDWGSIEFLPDSNRQFIDEALISAWEFRSGHVAPSGFATEIQYIPQHPFPLWTRHLPCPVFHDFERWEPELGDRLVEGGFAFVDTHSFWAIYGQHLPDFGVTFLCIRTHHFIPSLAFSNAVSDLTSDNHLCLVDWGRLCLVPLADPAGFKGWLSSYT